MESLKKYTIFCSDEIWMLYCVREFDKLSVTFFPALKMDKNWELLWEIKAFPEALYCIKDDLEEIHEKNFFTS